MRLVTFERSAHVVMVVFCFIVTGGVAEAQSTKKAELISEVVVVHGPWDTDSSEDQQLEAYGIFLEANKHFKNSSFSEAARQYQQAAEKWQHPAIYFNLSVAQRNLERLLDTYHSLLRAIEFGPDPLGQSKYERAKNTLEWLQGQLGHLEIICGDPGAEVTVNGKVLFIGPGRRTEVVLPGNHQVVADRIDRYPDTETLVLRPGQKRRIVLKLRTADDLETYRRWKWRIPGAVAGTGAAFLVLGRVLQSGASRKFDEYDERFGGICADGCIDENVDPEVTTVLHGATLRQNLSRASYGVGSAIVAVSAVMVAFNRKRYHKREREELGDSSLTLYLSGRGGGVTASFRF